MIKLLLANISTWSLIIKDSLCSIKVVTFAYFGGGGLAVLHVSTTVEIMEPASFSACGGSGEQTVPDKLI